MKELKNFYRSLFSRASSKSTSQQEDSASSMSTSGHGPGVLTSKGTKKLSKGVNGFTAMASDPGHASHYVYKDQAGKNMEIDGVATISRIPPPTIHTEQVSAVISAHHPQHGMPPQPAQSSGIPPNSQSARKTHGAVTAEYSSQEDMYTPAHMFSAAVPAPSMYLVTNSAQEQVRQQQHESVSQAAAAAPGQQEYESVTIRVSDHCPPAMRRDKWLVSDFELRAKLYNGNISVVYHAVDRRSGMTVALKGYKRNKLTAIERHQVSREIQLHTKLAHPSIIGMYAAWKDKSFVYMVLEWAPGGDVYSYLRRNGGRLPEKGAVALIIEPFLSGLALIHAQGLIHRDIKPENILLNNQYAVKIADFGLSIDSSNEVANTRLGTIDYLAPEILDCPVKQTPYDNKDNPRIGYTYKVDCWSCGVLAYELLVGQPPFASTTPYETLNLIRTKEVVYPIFLSLEAISFIKMLLVRDPQRRVGITEALDHPWIRKYSQRSHMLSSHLRPQKVRSLSHGALSQAVRSKSTAGAAPSHDQDEDMEVATASSQYTAMLTQHHQQQGDSDRRQGSSSKMLMHPGAMPVTASGKVAATRLAAGQGSGDEQAQDMLMALPGQMGAVLPAAPPADVALPNPNSAAARSQKFLSLQASQYSAGGVAVVNVAAHKAQLLAAHAGASNVIIPQHINGSGSGKLIGTGVKPILMSAAQASLTPDGLSACTSRSESPTSASRKGSVQLPPLSK